MRRPSARGRPSAECAGRLRQPVESHEEKGCKQRRNHGARHPCWDHSTLAEPGATGRKIQLVLLRCPHPTANWEQSLILNAVRVKYVLHYSNI